MIIRAQNRNKSLSRKFRYTEHHINGNKCVLSDIYYDACGYGSKYSRNRLAKSGISQKEKHEIMEQVL